MIMCWYFLMVPWDSELEPLACSRAMPSSVMSASSFFFWRMASPLALVSFSREACIDSIDFW